MTTTIYLFGDGRFFSVVAGYFLWFCGTTLSCYLPIFTMIIYMVEMPHTCFSCFIPCYLYLSLAHSLYSHSLYPFRLYTLFGFINYYFVDKYIMERWHAFFNRLLFSDFHILKHWTIVASLQQLGTLIEFFI